MSYLGVLEAIRARLEGQAFTFVPTHPDRVEGVNVETLLTRTSKLYTSGDTKVPIYFFGPDGALATRVYPSLSFDMLNVTPRFTEAVYDSESYGGEAYKVPVETSRKDVYDGDTLVEADRERLIRQRPLNHPVDYLFEIRALAKTNAESAALVAHVYRVFPPRHFLRVPMKDGSHRSWDVFFEGYRDLDTREAVKLGEIAEREYTKVFTYRVEGYFDNTELDAYVNLVRTRTIGIGGVDE